MRRFFGLVALLFAVPVLARPGGALPVFPVVFHVANEGGHPVTTDDALGVQLDLANRFFAPCGFAFRHGGRSELEERHARLETRSDRHGLGRAMDRGVIDVFVVASLRDVDDPTRLRMGVHWRPRGLPGRHFVVLAAYAHPGVLAHELGHFFGNGHSTVHGNLMSYSWGTSEPTLDTRQCARSVLTARRLLREGSLRP